MTYTPLVSVLMPVYNAQEFVAQAIESIISQTYKNFELIIVNDCSTDKTRSILSSYESKYPQIRILTNSARVGINACMSKAILESKGNFLARMDADDISLPKRLEKQVKYLLSHTKTVAVGGNFFVINKEGQLIGKRLFPKTFQDIYSYTFYFVGISQPVMMIAKKRLPQDFIYFNKETVWADDVELVYKLFLYGEVANIPHTILLYRMHENSHSLKNPKKTFYHTLKFRLKAIQKYKYRPSIKGILINFFQLILVTTLSNKQILLLYKKMRNEPLITSSAKLPQTIVKTALS